MEKLEEKIDEINKKVDAVIEAKTKEFPPKKPEEEEEKKKAEPSEIEKRVTGLETSITEMKSILEKTLKKLEEEPEKPDKPKDEDEKKVKKDEEDKPAEPTPVEPDKPAEETPPIDEVKMLDKMNSLEKKLETISKALVKETITTPRAVEKSKDTKDVIKSEDYALDVAQGRVKFNFADIQRMREDEYNSELNKILSR